MRFFSLEILHNIIQFKTLRRMTNTSYEKIFRSRRPRHSKSQNSSSRVIAYKMHDVSDIQVSCRGRTVLPERIERKIKDRAERWEGWKRKITMRHIFIKAFVPCPLSKSGSFSSFWSTTHLETRASLAASVNGVTNVASNNSPQKEKKLSRKTSPNHQKTYFDDPCH